MLWANRNGFFYALDQITPANVKNLEMRWVFQTRTQEKFENTPLVVDGVMYLTQPPNDVIALDAVTGRTFWVYTYRMEPGTRPCCGNVNRGLAILGDTLFMATVDGRLIAIDAKNGRVLWNVKVADQKAGYAITLAPLLPGILYLRTLLKSFWQMDELQRRIQIEGLGFALVGTLVVMTAMNILTAEGIRLVNYPQSLGIGGVYLTMFILWSIGVSISTFRYR